MTDTDSKFVDVLADCIEKIETDQLTIEACLERYPEHAVELGGLLRTMGELQSAPVVQPPSSFRQQARRRLIAQLQPLPIENVTYLEAFRQKWQNINLFPLPRRFSMAWIVSVVFIASLLLGGGTAFASDAAVPGQLLYPLDRSIEELRVSLNKDPATLVELQLAFAEERLSEAQIVVSGEEVANFHEALDGYGESIAAIARVVDSTEGLDRDTLGQLLEQALPNHDASLARFTALDEPEPDNGDEDDDDENSFCSGDQPHPVAQRLDDQYDGVDIEQIMTWFCGDDEDEQPGFGFGQIMLALQTAGGDSDLAGVLLASRADGSGWGQIWQELGLIGKPAEVGPPGDAGRPDDVGRPDDAGRPDDVGRPDDAGRPDHAGPPEGVSPVDAPPDDAGPPEGVPPVDAPPDDGGPPEGVPPVDAPPDDAGPPEGAPPVDAPPDDAGPPEGVPPVDASPDEVPPIEDGPPGDAPPGRP
jgi:hypothetical protein